LLGHRDHRIVIAMQTSTIRTRLVVKTATKAGKPAEGTMNHTAKRLVVKTATKAGTPRDATMNHSAVRRVIG
jgi:hypothetical protein